MKKSALINLYNQDQRINVTYPDLIREETAELVRHTGKTNSVQGVVIFSKLNETNADLVIQKTVNYYSGQNQDFEWKVYEFDQPEDLKERLAGHGFTIEEPEAILVLDLQEAPSVLWKPVLHNIKRLMDRNKLNDVKSIQTQVWKEDFDWLDDYLGESLNNDPQRFSVYAAYVDHEPASAAWAYYPPNSQFASLWGGSTVEKYRNRGLYTALLAVRAQEARSRGVRFLTVDASPLSQPILEKFGFQLLGFATPCVWENKDQDSGEQA